MRNLRTSKLAFLILGLALALGVSLAATAQTSAPDTQPAAGPSTQSAPAPDTHQSDQAQPKSQSQGTSVDDELELTPDQKQKIADVVDDENKQIGAVRDDTSLTLEQKQQKAREIQQAGVPKIKAVLTPEQLQKLAAIQERNRQQPQSNPQVAPHEPAQH
jgi:Spy/CpxP family protein refolding chaperone